MIRLAHPLAGFVVTAAISSNQQATTWTSANFWTGSQLLGFGLLIGCVRIVALTRLGEDKGQEVLRLRIGSFLNTYCGARPVHALHNQSLFTTHRISEEPLCISPPCFTWASVKDAISCELEDP